MQGEASSPQDRFHWCAGFFDGEGCISMMKRKSRADALTMRVSLANTERAPVELFHEMFGGYTYCDERKAPRQPIHFWHLAAVGEIKPFLEVMIPYLFVKREQAEIALMFLNRRRGPGHRPVDRAQDEADFQKLRALKRGVRAA